MHCSYIFPGSQKSILTCDTILVIILFFYVGFKPKLPLFSDEDRLWVDEGFNRLSRVLGRDRMLEAEIILPDPEYFPDVYDKSESAVEKMFLRICDYMQVDRSRINLEIFADEEHALSQILPYWKGGHGGCAGIYFHPDDETRKMIVALRHSQMEDPMALVATLAHELAM